MPNFADIYIHLNPFVIATLFAAPLAACAAIFVFLSDARSARDSDARSACDSTGSDNSIESDDSEKHPIEA